MSNGLPTDWNQFSELRWEQIASHADELLHRDLDARSLDAWLKDWAALSRLIFETFNRFYIRTTTHADDEAGQNRYREYSEGVMPKFRAFEQAMKTRLLESGLQPADFEVPLRRMRSDAQIYREANLPLRTKAERLETEFEAISAARKFEWDGATLTASEVWDKLSAADRTTRERAWRALTARLESDRPSIDAIWNQFLDVRLEMARNAGFPDYRSFRWRELGRFDYTPEDCKSFHAAIQEVWVPAVLRLADKRKRSLGADRLRVWDDCWHVRPDAEGRPPLQPYATIDELTSTTERIFSRLHPQFAAHYHQMRSEDLLDLEARPGKSQGGYMQEFPASLRAFIFTNAVRASADVDVQLHESGHAFHMYAAGGWPHHYQSMLEYMPIEFTECASMGMELLAAPYLAAERGGFYNKADLAQLERERFTGILEFLPYMAAVDAFQHWVYENPAAAHDSAQCDENWAAIHRSFMPHLDWTGIEASLGVWWRMQGHIVASPFYYVEYGMAQLGAVQLWANALEDEKRAVNAYRTALSLGNTATLPDLYRAAGIKFAFDRETLQRLVGLLEHKLSELEQ